MSLQGLQQLVQRIQLFFQQQDHATQAQQVWERAERLTVEWLDSWQRQQPFWLAQLALPAQTSLPGLLATRYAVLLSLYCRQQQWPEWQREHLLTSCWFLIYWQQSALIHYSQQSLPDDQQQWIQDPWAYCVRLLQKQPFDRDTLRLFASCSRLRRGYAEWQQNAISSVCVLTYRLAIAMQPVKGMPWPGIEQPVRVLWRSPLPQGQRLVLKRLLQAEPALHQFARLCTDHIGTICLITRPEPELSGYEFDLSMKLLADEVKPITSHGFTLLPPRFCKDVDWWQNMISPDDLPDEQHEATPISLAVLQQLNPNWGVSKQLQWLERQPELLPFLLQAASDQTKQHLQITDPRHALAMLGTDQLPQILRLSWLQQQMQRQQGPLGHWFTQAAKVLASTLRGFGLKSPNLSLVHSEADVIAVAIMLVLQRETPMSALQLAFTGSQQSPVADYCQQLLWQHTELPNHCSQLLAAVSPKMLWTDAVLTFRREPDVQPRYSQQQTAQLLLRLALLEFQQSYLGHSVPTELMHSCFSKAQQALDLPHYSLTEWRQLILADGQHHQPIHSDL